MSGLENILSDFLSSAENVKMLENMASSMGIDLPKEKEEPAKISKEEQGFAGLLSGLAPGDDTSQLLRALKPFLSDDMARKVESTVTAACIAQAAGGFLFKPGADLQEGR